MDNLVAWLLTEFQIILKQYLGLDPVWGTLIGASAGAAVTFFIVLGYFRRARHTHYGELDSIYFDLLRLRIEAPATVAPEISETRSMSTDETRASTRGVLLDRTIRDNYSYMIWTFIETIYDRAVDSKKLQITWQPIIRTEGSRHLDYFGNQHEGAARQEAFQEGFLDFIRRGGFSSYTKDAAEKSLNVRFSALAQTVLGKPREPNPLAGITGYFRRRWILLLASFLALCGGLLVAYLTFSVSPNR